MTRLAQLETRLAEIFIGKAPKLPTRLQKIVIEFAPWLVLLCGIGSLLAAAKLWFWAHLVDRPAEYVNSLCHAYAGTSNLCSKLPASRLDGWFWLSLVVQLALASLYFLAFPGLRDRKKQGWNYAYYAEFVVLANAIISLFTLTGYNVAASILAIPFSALLGFWVLFQVRGAYADVPTDTPITPDPKN